MKFRFADLRTAIMRATERHMATCYPDLPPLAWFLDESGALTGQSETGDRAEVDAWVSALGLTADATPDGSYQFSGAFGGGHIVVWAVTDREAWEAGGRR